MAIKSLDNIAGFISYIWTLMLERKFMRLFDWSKYPKARNMVEEEAKRRGLNVSGWRWNTFPDLLLRHSEDWFKEIGFDAKMEFSLLKDRLWLRFKIGNCDYMRVFNILEFVESLSTLASKPQLVLLCGEEEFEQIDIVRQDAKNFNQFRSLVLQKIVALIKRKEGASAKIVIDWV